MTLLLLLLVPRLARSQGQATPAASPPRALGYVRFWNMLSGKAVPTLELLSADDKPLSTATAHNYTANYNSITPGTYTFVVRKVGDTLNPLKKQSVLLRGDTFITFLVSEKNGHPTVDLIDDTLDPKKVDSFSRLTVRQFMPGARVVVTTRDGKSTPELAYGENATLESLANTNTPLSMKATGLGSEPKTWNTEADFTNARHATLLVVPDPYGRFRPRLTYDGQFGAKPDPTPTPKP